jgi:beta-glucosidase
VTRAGTARCARRVQGLLVCCLTPALLAMPRPAWSAAASAHPGLWPHAHSTGLVDAATERRIGALMARMSLEEKVGQVIQADIDSIRPADLRRYPLGSIMVGGDPAPNGDMRAPPEVWLAMTRAFQRTALERRTSHTPIPLLMAIDAAHGIAHVRGATVFPQQIGLGAARDPDLIRGVGAVTAQEAAAVGFNWALTPTLAIPQDLRWGRTYESWSEDPALVRDYAGEMVRGLQNESGVPVAATAKHFLGDGATAGGRDQGDAPVTEQELIRTHVQGYVGAIDAGVMTVMVSYSSWQGLKLHGNQRLLTGVLKGRLGFEGLVVGDWNGHNQLDECSSESCPRAMNAGLDMFMAPDSWQGLFQHTLLQVRAGEIPMSRLNDAVRRVLRVKFRLGLLGHTAAKASPLDRLGDPEHRALARRAVRESLVLLKNEGGVLPIRSSAHVLIAGAGADDVGQQCGGWTLSWQGAVNHNADFPRADSIYAGIASAVESGGGVAELSVEGRYTRLPDVAIVVYGEPPYAESLGDRATLEYQSGADTALALLERLREAHIPIVSVFLSGRPLQVPTEIAESDAFVAAWLPGTEGAGIADVLIGDAGGVPRFDFSGTLPFGWPAQPTDSDAVLSKADRTDLAFPFGYGLRYPAQGMK